MLVHWRDFPLLKVSLNDLDQLFRALGARAAFTIRIDDVHPDMVLNDFSHQAIHCSARCDHQMKDVGTALFFLDRAFERFHLTTKTSHSGQQLCFLFNRVPHRDSAKQWEDAWRRVVEARAKLKSFEHDAIVRHILVLDNIKPGDTVSFDDYSYGEQVPPLEVLNALENFNRALRREDGVFRQLRKSDVAAVAARRKFE